MYRPPAGLIVQIAPGILSCAFVHIDTHEHKEAAGWPPMYESPSTNSQQYGTQIPKAFFCQYILLWVILDLEFLGMVPLGSESGV